MSADIVVTVSVTNPTADLTRRMLELYQELQGQGLAVSMSSFPVDEEPAP